MNCTTIYDRVMVFTKVERLLINFMGDYNVIITKLYHHKTIFCLFCLMLHKILRLKDVTKFCIDLLLSTIDV